MLYFLSLLMFLFRCPVCRVCNAGIPIDTTCVHAQYCASALLYCPLIYSRIYCYCYYDDAYPHNDQHFFSFVPYSDMSPTILVKLPPAPVQHQPLSEFKQDRKTEVPYSTVHCLYNCLQPTQGFPPNSCLHKTILYCFSTHSDGVSPIKRFHLQVFHVTATH